MNKKDIETWDIRSFEDLKDWLFKKRKDWWQLLPERCKRMICISLFGLGGILLSGALIVLFSRLFWDNWRQSFETSPPWALIATLITAPLVLLLWAIRLWHKECDLELNKNAQIADRFNKAVERLRNEDQYVQIGAICELEFISRYSQPDHGRVLDVIGEFIRDNANKKDSKSRIAIRHAFMFLGRRRWIETESGRFNLTGIALENVCFAEAPPRKAKFQRFNFSGATLNGADLRHCNLRKAVFNRVDLVDLSVAKLDNTTDLTNAWYDDKTKVPEEFKKFMRDSTKVWKEDDHPPDEDLEKGDL